ncbi:MAG: HDOD domain-containing protein [Phycisphaerales bacterium]|nr:HDOD domain-containing protein [Phycisphaerales bacterium]
MSTITQESREAVVSKAIAEISHIATLPEVTLRIIDLVEDPSSTAQDLNKLITNDPALCSRILKVVNSAFYGLPGQIGSINRAIVLLGLNAVKNIAIATSLAKLFRGGELCPSFSARDLWIHSTAVAAASKLLADAASIGLSDEAFLAGLLHDVGIMVEMQAGRHKLIEVFEQFPNARKPFTAVEDDVLGANHQDFGRALCERWKFPKSFGYVTGYHHRPLELEAGSRTLTSVVYIADWLAKKSRIGFVADVTTGQVESSILDELRLTEAEIENVETQLPDAIDQVNSFLGG